jgi:hypothetical protein
MYLRLRTVQETVAIGMIKEVEKDEVPASGKKGRKGRK